MMELIPHKHHISMGIGKLTDVTVRFYSKKFDTRVYIRYLGFYYFPFTETVGFWSEFKRRFRAIGMDLR